MTGARVFVATAFVVLAASFLASTALLIWEFRDTGWQTMLAAHSHLFVFFPLFGIVALAAFYVPAVVFTHLYWTYLPYGKVRFLGGLLVLAGLAVAVSWWLDKEPRALYEVAPSALAADRGETVACPSGTTCRRAALLDALANVRLEAQRHIGLSKFARSCKIDPYLEFPQELTKRRWCFPAAAMLSGDACCQVQARFAAAVGRLHADPAQRSLSATWDRAFLPLKSFFVLIVVAIGALLVAWRYKLDEHYLKLVPAIERGLLVGASAMLLWPLMDYAYQQIANVLNGRSTQGVQLRLSLVIGPWALLLLFYFLHRFRQTTKRAAQTSGVTALAVAVLRYQELNDWSVRVLGMGSDGLILALLAALAALALWPLVRRQRPLPA